jgi:hypothetical protein
VRFSGHFFQTQNIFMVFLSSSCRETAKNATNKTEGKKSQDFVPLNFFGKKFLTWTTPKSF